MPLSTDSPSQVRKKYGGRMGAGAGGLGLMVSDAARARAIEVLKSKEKELVTKVSFAHSLAVCTRTHTRRALICAHLHHSFF